MERQPEYGVCRLVQEHFQSVLEASPHTTNCGAVVISTDEGDYETKLAVALAKHRSLCALISIGGLSRGGMGVWSVAVEVAVHEDVVRSRGSNRQTTTWTALRFAEMVIATFHETRMSDAPFANITVDANALTLEQESPSLLYRVRLNAGLGANLVF